MKLILITILLFLMSGCVVKFHDIEKPNGEKEKIRHFGFPDFSEDKTINLIKVN